MRDIRRKIGLVFQYPEYQLFEETVEKDVAFGPANLGLEEEAIRQRVREAIGLVGLDYEEIRGRSPFDLSGGQKRRVAIAGVIAMKPEVLILDEPTAGLDPKAHRDVLDMIRTVHQHEKNITFLVSHNMNDIARMADKILVMDNGRLVMQGTPLEVFAQEESLASMGLGLPEPARLMKLAVQKGIPFDGSFLTTEDAEEALYQFFEKGLKYMIRDITLGQYYPGESWIHRLDPRIKIIATLAYIVALFIVADFWGFLIAFLALGIVIAVSRVPLKFILKGLKPIFLIILFTFIINMFMIPGEVLARFFFLTITREGLRTAFFMGTRLVLLIIGSSLLTLTTKPISLTDGIEALLSPMKRLGVPAHELAMMMTIALRFIPTLLEETDKIMKAQQARGADFESGNIIRRAKSLIPLLVPLFISAFRIAQELAMAMEARCYRGGQHRTRMNGMKLRKRDLAAVVLLVLFLASIVLERILL